MFGGNETDRSPKIWEIAQSNNRKKKVITVRKGSDIVFKKVTKFIDDKEVR